MNITKCKRSEVEEEAKFGLFRDYQHIRAFLELTVICIDKAVMVTLLSVDNWVKLPEDDISPWRAWSVHSLEVI